MSRDPEPPESDVSGPTEVPLASAGVRTAAASAAAVGEHTYLHRLRSSAPSRDVRLGLAISRELARAMGGDLTVSGTAQAGATFDLTLQRAGSTGPGPL